MANILVVEEDWTVCRLIRLAFVEEGHDVICLDSAAAALTYVQACPSVDLILLDMQTPDDDDGWSFLRAYQRVSPAHAPVVVMSASSDFDVEALRACAASFIAKPFDLDDLVALAAESYSEAQVKTT